MTSDTSLSRYRPFHPESTGVADDINNGSVPIKCPEEEVMTNDILLDLPQANRQETLSPSCVHAGYISPNLLYIITQNMI